MFLSGRWRGYWEQPGLGRQPMHDLVLQFAEGTIAGHGRDVVGQFTFAGSYNDRGEIMLIKQYPFHQVLYKGEPDGEGAIVGTWTILSDSSGPFALTPLTVPPNKDQAIQEIR